MTKCRAGFATASRKIAVKINRVNGPLYKTLLIFFLGVSKQLSTIIEGESLLNDGMAIVLYKIFYNLSFSSMTREYLHVGMNVETPEERRVQKRLRRGEGTITTKRIQSET